MDGLLGREKGRNLAIPVTWPLDCDMWVTSLLDRNLWVDCDMLKVRDSAAELVDRGVCSTVKAVLLHWLLAQGVQCSAACFREPLA